MTGKKILICVCGGIAAYKVCEVVSRLVQAGAEVTVAMTEEATQFVGAITFQALTARPVYLNLWTHVDSQDPQHVRLAQQADVIVVAPATANMLAKMAHGLADDLVSTLLLAADPKKVMAAPAMNEGMWNHPATQRNVQSIMQAGVHLVGPNSGWQACRTVGMGRMAQPDEICDAITKRVSTTT